MSLTDTAIRRTKPTAAVQKLRDGGGLYLLLKPDGARWWRWDYRRPVTAARPLRKSVTLFMAITTPSSIARRLQ